MMTLSQGTPGASTMLREIAAKMKTTKKQIEETQVQKKATNEAKKMAQDLRKKTKKTEKQLRKRYHPLKTGSDFADRFRALPQEIQVMIIAEVVRTPEEVNASYIGSASRRLRAPFRRDLDLRVESIAQFRTINTFCFRLGGYFPTTGDVGSTVRTLNIDYKLRLEGANLDAGAYGSLSKRDADNFAAVPQIFPHLEDFTVRVRNTGNVLFRFAHYTSVVHGICIRAKNGDGYAKMERMCRMGAIIDLVRDYQFHPRRQGAGPTRKKVVFNQVEKAAYTPGTVLQLVDYKDSPGVNSFEGCMGEMMLFDRIEISFEESGGTPVADESRLLEG